MSDRRKPAIADIHIHYRGRSYSVNGPLAYQIMDAILGDGAGLDRVPTPGATSEADKPLPPLSHAPHDAAGFKGDTGITIIIGGRVFIPAGALGAAIREAAGNPQTPDAEPAPA